MSDLQQSNGLPEAGPEAGLEDAEGEPERDSVPEPVRFGWVKGVMVSVIHPPRSILLLHKHFTLVAFFLMQAHVL